MDVSHGNSSLSLVGVDQPWILRLDGHLPLICKQFNLPNLLSVQTEGQKREQSLKILAYSFIYVCDLIHHCQVHKIDMR